MCSPQYPIGRSSLSRRILQHSKAFFVRPYVPLDHPLLNFSDRQRRASLVFSKELEIALSVFLRAQSQ